MIIILEDKKYEIQKINALEGLKLQLRVSKLLGGVTKDLKGINKETFSDLLQADVSALIPLIGTALNSVDEDKVLLLLTDLIKYVKVLKTEQGTSNEHALPVDINNLEIMDFYTLGLEVIKLNLGKFIDDLKSKLSNQSVAKKQDN